MAVVDYPVPSSCCSLLLSLVQSQPSLLLTRTANSLLFTRTANSLLFTRTANSLLFTRTANSLLFTRTANSLSFSGSRQPLVHSWPTVWGSLGACSLLFTLLGLETQDRKRCQYCQKSFAHSSSLSKHIRKEHHDAHSANKSIPCNKCPER